MKSAVAVWLVVCCSAVHADMVDDWARQPELVSARISPKGDYLAVLREEDDQFVVAVFEFPEMKLINVIDPPGRSEVGNYWWVNDERILISVAVDWGNREDDVSYGELYAVNADGKKGKYLFGLRGDQLAQTRSRVAKVQAEYGSARLQHAMWHDPKTVLIQVFEWSRGYNNVTYTAKLDVYTGRLTNRIGAPASNAFLLADLQGEVRFSYHTDDDQVSVIHYRSPDTGQWEEFSRAPYGESQITPRQMSEDGRIYVTRAVNEGPAGLYLMDPKTQALEKLYQHDRVDLMDVLSDYQDRVYGAFTIPDRYEQVFFDQDHPSAQLRLGLAQAFPDGFPIIYSTTHDFRLTVLRIQTDVRSPEFYLYDRKSGELALLFDAMPWLDDDRISPMEPIRVTARDGLELDGYLTIPKGAPRKNLPLVIVPHGGPHGPRDQWGFQWFEGFLPAAGYAILQINYRGSGGYGQAFETRGFREWGKKMQDDLTDATQWAIDQGIADPDRICIFGWSYGGYATLMGIIREPGLYQCAVAGAGVYDQIIQYQEADLTDQTRWGKKFMAKVVGDTDQALAEASPISYVNRIRTPLLLVHGEDDERVPIEHAYALQKAYRTAGKPEPELVMLRNEPHTPNNEDNMRTLFRRTVQFIEKHIGKGIPPSGG